MIRDTKHVNAVGDTMLAVQALLLLLCTLALSRILIGCRKQQIWTYSMMSSLALQYVMCVAVICWCSGNEQKIGFGAAGIRQRQRDIQSTCICHKMH